jgi:hypothetical protein
LHLVCESKWSNVALQQTGLRSWRAPAGKKSLNKREAAGWARS